MLRRLKKIRCVWVSGFRTAYNLLHYHLCCFSSPKSMSRECFMNNLCTFIPCFVCLEPPLPMEVMSLTSWLLANHYESRNIWFLRSCVIFFFFQGWRVNSVKIEACWRMTAIFSLPFAHCTKAHTIFRFRTICKYCFWYLALMCSKNISLISALLLPYSLFRPNPARLDWTKRGTGESQQLELWENFLSPIIWPPGCHQGGWKPIHM